ncbi:MAG: hypothetical protein QOE23_2176 [Pseudonocardiales bacterium]|jgi:hypothetical protein|nr:hypothetical protein [Pseudonocardiales bacterium]
MTARSGVVAAIVLLAGIGLAGCKSSSATEAEPDRAATVTEVSGQPGIHRVELTADGAERIGLQTATVRSSAAAGQPVLSVPLSAVLYDQHGATWVFVSTGKLAFQRARVSIRTVVGDQALLASGPAAGSTVATLGAAELLGAEDGVPGE